MANHNFLDIFHLESRYPVFAELCAHLPIGSIVALARTCRQLSGLYQSLVPRLWNVDRCLQRFLHDPQFFRSQMAKYNALVSGSLVMQFFERGLWEGSDLDIYIEKGKSADAFGNYLTEKEGYKLIQTTENELYLMFDLAEVWTYTRRSNDDSSEVQVQIILTENIPLQAILRSFYSTAVVNFFTWNKAYAIFPLHTFVRHKGYLLKPLSDYYSEMLKKYSRRGWRFQEVMWPEEMSSNQPIRDIRRIGDQFTWMIPFDTSDVTWSETPDSVDEYAAFAMNLEDDSPRVVTKHYKIKAYKFEAEVLRHRYLFGDTSWMEFLGARVDELTKMELYKMAREARPWGYQMNPITRLTSMYGCMSDTPKPHGWTFWDDEIPTWYEAWLKAHALSKTG